LITAQWKPAPPWTAAQLGVGLVLLVLAPFVDPLGAVLLVPAGCAALGLGLRDLLLSPVLTADAAGITVVEGMRRTRAAWPQVTRVRTVRDRRTPLLEIDLDDRVVVLSGRRLGAPVEDVLAALAALR
jgi:hypothetical protein